jgi:hypothetical protein
MRLIIQRNRTMYADSCALFMSIRNIKQMLLLACFATWVPM